MGNFLSFFKVFVSFLMQPNSNFVGQEYGQVNQQQQGQMDQQPPSQQYYILQQPVQQQQMPNQQMYFKQDNKPMGNMQDKMQIAQSSSTQTLDLRKTKICPVIKQGMKRCPKGDRCNFAHSNEELRSKPNLSKTKMCPNITKTGHCEMGDQCNYAHSELELRSTPNLYKTALCNSFMAGECKLGEYCRFAHGESELRTPVNKSSPEPNQNQMLQMQNYFGGSN